MAGKITSDTAGKLMYTENAELDAKIGKLGVAHIYKGRGEIMKFLDWITKRTQPGPLDCTTATCRHILRLASAKQLLAIAEPDRGSLVH